MPRAQRIAFVCPRFLRGETAGGAETLLRELARCAAAHGRRVEFLTTCAQDHFTWNNDRPPGVESVDGLTVRFFPVDADRNLESFHRIQQRISRGQQVTAQEERAWLQNGVHSTALYRYLDREGTAFDLVVAGPYLFALVCEAARHAPQRCLLVPCLHDEPFAYLRCTRRLFQSVRGCLFNSPPERELAVRLFGETLSRSPVVGMGLEPFDPVPEAFLSRFAVRPPYILYAGRRETLKGTPLLLDYFAAFRSRTGRPLRLVLLGSGPIEVPRQAADDVVDCGFVSETDKHNAMAGSLTFCHPSVNESLGIVVLESWLAGRPALVHARSHVLREHCRIGGGGLWFRTYPEFEESVLWMLDHPDECNALGTSGQAYVRREYDWSNVGGRLMQALDAGVSAPRRPSG